MPKYRRAGNSVSIETTGHEIEDQTADRFEQALRYEGVSLGERQRRDGKGLRIDFVFEEAQPAIALEITRIVDVNVHQVGSFLHKMGETLTAIAREEDLGFWNIAAKDGWKSRTLVPAIAQFMRDARSQAPPAAFAVAASKLDAAPLPEELSRLGLFTAVKQRGESGVHVWPPVSGDLSGTLGFSDQLASCIADKDPVLREARPRETHLAVLVEDTRFVADPVLSPPPKLTEAVDGLWVFLSDFLAPRYGHRVWRVRRGMSQWDLLWHRLW